MYSLQIAPKDDISTLSLLSWHDINSECANFDHHMVTPFLDTTFPPLVLVPISHRRTLLWFPIEPSLLLQTAARCPGGLVPRLFFHKRKGKI